MTRTLAKATVGLTLTLMLGCAATPPVIPERKPVRWVVVERAVGAILPSGRSGDGHVDPQAVILTMQPLYSEDVNWEVVVDPHDFFVEVLEITPSAQVSPGETVSARVRVGRAKEGDHYRLIARPSQPEVHIIGEPECVVRGGKPVLFRFTSESQGRAGIAVAVERIEGGGR